MRSNIASLLDSKAFNKNKHVCGIFSDREEAKEIIVNS